ncbi:hypothetical protein LX32DRAFT_635443 [Colletotrichum zoysiae]|uniref:Uncharacterized protein n=1 Tax=Colletotrichum zoysiae TaxID=1216348 RepID=A0AAD9HS48_9PEZI|nr:hypothetical protein LX32DRAFT_635443 [Colletotrichum zoysiae]
MPGSLFRDRSAIICSIAIFRHGLRLVAVAFGRLIMFGVGMVAGRVIFRNVREVCGTSGYRRTSS